MALLAIVYLISAVFLPPASSKLLSVCSPNVSQLPSALLPSVAPPRSAPSGMLSVLHFSVDPIQFALSLSADPPSAVSPNRKVVQCYIFWIVPPKMSSR